MVMILQNLSMFMQSNYSWCIETIVEFTEVELGCKTNIYQEETTWDFCGGKDGRQLAPAMGFQLECWSGGGQKWGGGKRWENLDFGLVSGP